MNLYFDNASTSFPKPPEVGEYVNKYLNQGGTYGRAAYYRNIEVSRMVEFTRSKLAEIIGTSLITNIIFSNNSTITLNTIVKGFNYKHRKVLISPLEHNSVSRPLEYLKTIGVTDYQVLPHQNDGLIDIEQLKLINFEYIDLVIINHVSNVNGVIQPIEKIKMIIGEVPILIDASQSLGKVDLFADRWGVDYVAFTGHKGLLGPTGIGGCFIRNPETISPFIHGGTGSNSDKLGMPEFCPDKFEAGTQNIMGIYGLYGALLNRPKIFYSETLFHSIIDRISKLKNIRLLAANNRENQSDVFSIIPINRSVSEFSRLIYDRYKIEIRSGLHCSAIAHQNLMSFPYGAARFSLSNYHSNEDLDYLLNCIIELNDN